MYVDGGDVQVNVVVFGSAVSERRSAALNVRVLRAPGIWATITNVDQNCAASATELSSLR